MRHLAAPFLISSALLGACADSGPWSPSDPKQFDRSMINEPGLVGLSADNQAYVMGHAIGVYLMGKTLPHYVAEHGYLYAPGRSSPYTTKEYVWWKVLRARSGGSDGNGGMIFDDVGQPLYPQVYPEQGDLGDPPEPGDPSDDVDYGEDPDGYPGGSPPDGDTPPDGDGDGVPDYPMGDPNDPDGDGDGDCGVINRQCAAFMNPAAFDARGLADQVDPAKFAESGVTGVELDRFVNLFEQGMSDALTVEGLDDFLTNSEVVYTSDDVQGYGYCEN